MLPGVGACCWQRCGGTDDKRAFSKKQSIGVLVLESLSVRSLRVLNANV